VQRLLPFAAALVLFQALLRPSWLGVSVGLLVVQLVFGLLLGTLLFVGAALVRSVLARRRGALVLPGGARDLLLQTAYYIVNAPLEEGVFRGLLQGGLGAAVGAPAGFVVGTATYVLYHRLGGWTWSEVAATILVGAPLGLAFWLLPGPPSLLGVSIAHAAATCGFLGPGPYLLRRLRLV
jgi:membrane protease YdiL (CAAX protease family)